MKVTMNKLSKTRNESAAEVEIREKKALANLKRKCSNVKWSNTFTRKKYFLDKEKKIMNLIEIIRGGKAKVEVNLGRDNMVPVVEKYRD